MANKTYEDLIKEEEKLTREYKRKLGKIEQLLEEKRIVRDRLLTTQLTYDQSGETLYMYPVSSPEEDDILLEVMNRINATHAFEVTRLNDNPSLVRDIENITIRLVKDGLVPVNYVARSASRIGNLRSYFTPFSFALALGNPRIIKGFLDSKEVDINKPYLDLFGARETEEYPALAPLWNDRYNLNCVQAGVYKELFSRNDLVFDDPMRGDQIAEAAVESYYYPENRGLSKDVLQDFVEPTLELLTVLQGRIDVPLEAKKKIEDQKHFVKAYKKD